jgi:hypothetical protein
VSGSVDSERQVLQNRNGYLVLDACQAEVDARGEGLHEQELANRVGEASLNLVDCGLWSRHSSVCTWSRHSEGKAQR